MRPEIQKRSYRIERDFGLVVGGVFVALSLWWLFRGRFQAIAPYLLALGATLILSGLVVPKALVWPNRLWMGLAAALSFVMTRVILAIVFFALVTPIGLFRRLIGGDPLNRRAAPSESYWKPYLSRQGDPRHYEKMY
ncbi:MAG TPA: SxtJ family membrane protein [Blastocatellia bacterium]|nr:SxtJ family membrane protein [Blastocatellia bacterium]